ncbi:hypothetical protein LINGRAHAP2_LOCUS7757, partial [Linum grandiflorum]
MFLSDELSMCDLNGFVFTGFRWINLDSFENDWISLLPDDILHCILRRLPTSKQAAHTSALSRRWRSLWQSYPVVEFYYHNCSSTRPLRNLENLADASITKFSRDRLQGMAKLTLIVQAWDDTVIPLVVKLLNLASNRNQQRINITDERVLTKLA